MLERGGWECSSRKNKGREEERKGGKTEERKGRHGRHGRRGRKSRAKELTLIPSTSLLIWLG